jgi:molybdenum cofactor biosynthesis enzyme MoaA
MKNKWLVIHLTTKCNFNCRFCIIGYKKDEERIDQKTLKQNLKLLPSFEKIILSGGEPTTIQDILDVVKIIKTKTKKIAIQTNGLILSKKHFCKKLVDLGVTEATISIHSHNRKMFDYITQTKGYLPQVLKGIENAIDLGMEVKTSTVISKCNKEEISDTVSFLSNKFPKLDKIKIVFASFNPLSKKSEFISLAQAKPIILKVSNLGISNVSFENVPLCIYDSRETNSNNMNVHKIILLNEKGIVDPEHRKFIQKCKDCNLKNECQGIYKNYSLFFNPENELSPIKSIQKSF